MAKDAIPLLAKEFLESYDVTEKDRIWREQSEAFRKFWATKIMGGRSSPPTEDECDAVIRFLDRNGKGNTKKTEAIARAMIPQGAWRRMFAEFSSNRELGALMNSILEESDYPKRAALIDRLYQANIGRKNNLTGESGNAVNALLAGFDPFSNSSVISLKDRKTLLEYLGVVVSFKWDSASIGERITLSNQALVDALRSAGISGSARTLSVFCYWNPFKELWRGGDTAKRLDRTVTVTVPVSEKAGETEEVKTEDLRESLQIQAMLAEIGSRMGLKIWLPKSDRARVLTKWKAKDGDLLDELPLHYDQTTLKTIQEIDVLWLRRRSIIRAFEVEHTTSVYSGLLRMADLIALQPNMAINLHIVAPSSRREKVFEEIQRPVFSLLEGRALSEICTYISYEDVRELAALKHLEHLSDSVVEEFAEQAEV